MALSIHTTIFMEQRQQVLWAFHRACGAHMSMSLLWHQWSYFLQQTPHVARRFSSRIMVAPQNVVWSRAIPQATPCALRSPPFIMPRAELAPALAAPLGDVVDVAPFTRMRLSVTVLMPRSKDGVAGTSAHATIVNSGDRFIGNRDDACSRRAVHFGERCRQLLPWMSWSLICASTSSCTLRPRLDCLLGLGDRRERDHNLFPHAYHSHATISEQHPYFSHYFLSCFLFLML
jgi:hypothetical protein